MDAANDDGHKVMNKAHMALQDRWAKMLPGQKGAVKVQDLQVLFQYLLLNF